MNLEASDILRAMMHHYRDDLAKVAKERSIWRCFDCKREIPRSELPMRCPTCSGPDLKGKKIGYRHLKVRQEAMICINCVDRHASLCKGIKQKIFELQLQAYEQGQHRRLGVN